MWDLIQRCSQFRFYPDGKIAGFDISHILEMARVFGHEEYEILLLMEYAGYGLQDAIQTLNQES